MTSRRTSARTLRRRIRPGDGEAGFTLVEMLLVIAILAPMGDLFASMIKRDCEIKDTGKLFGPHGGLIDRLDAILFTIVAGYYLAVAILY